MPPSTWIGRSGPTSVAQPADLAGRGLDERLTAPTRVHRHAEHEVQQVHDLGDGLDRGGRVDRKAGQTPGVPDLLQREVHVRCRLGLDRDRVGARGGELLDLALRVLDHQMAVENAARGMDLFADGLHDHRADRDRRDEVAVHHVDVNHPRARVHHGLDLLGQPRVVGRQDRRLDLLGADQLPGVHGLQHGKCEASDRLQHRATAAHALHLIRVAHAHDRRVLAAGRAVGHQLEARRGSTRTGSAPRAGWGAAMARRSSGSCGRVKRDRRRCPGAARARRHPCRSKAAMKNPSVPSRCGRV